MKEDVFKFGSALSWGIPKKAFNFIAFALHQDPLIETLFYLGLALSPGVMVGHPEDGRANRSPVSGSHKEAGHHQGTGSHGTGIRTYYSKSQVTARPNWFEGNSIHVSHGFLLLGSLTYANLKIVIIILWSCDTTMGSFQPLLWIFITWARTMLDTVWSKYGHGSACWL